MSPPFLGIALPKDYGKYFFVHHGSDMYSTPSLSHLSARHAEDFVGKRILPDGTASERMAVAPAILHFFIAVAFEFGRSKD
jgi:hypothetical protein